MAPSSCLSTTLSSLTDSPISWVPKSLKMDDFDYHGNDDYMEMIANTPCPRNHVLRSHYFIYSSN